MQLNSTLKSHADHAAYKWPSRGQKNILEALLSQSVWAWVQADIKFCCILQSNLPKYFVLSYHLPTLHVVHANLPQCEQLTAKTRQVWETFWVSCLTVCNFLISRQNCSLQTLHEEKAKLQCSVKTMHCNDGYSINKGKSSMLYVPKLNCWTLKKVKSRHSILDQNKVPSKYSSFLFRLLIVTNILFVSRRFVFSWGLSINVSF